MAISAVITACDRLDLLERTLGSFLSVNTYPIKRFIIRDDSGLEGVWQKTDSLMKSFNIPFSLLKRGQLGQIKSIDRLMSEVKTPWVLHMEDDWHFTGDFIGKALDIWQDDFIQVWIRPKSDGIKTATPKRVGNYYVAEPTRFSFNPHIRRMDNYIPYESIPDIGKTMEDSISKYYKDMRVGWLANGYCKHIGWDKTTNRPGTPYHHGVKKA